MSELNRERVKQMKAGDEAAFEWLLDSFEQPVYRFLFCAVGGNADLALELSGEVFSEFVMALKSNKLRDPDRLSGFIFGIARNLVRRTRTKRRGLSLDQMDRRVDVPCEKPGIPEQMSVREELHLALHVIGQLRDGDRQIMLLRFVEGFTLQTIADQLDIPVNTVKVIIHRCRKKIQANLQLRYQGYNYE